MERASPLDRASSGSFAGLRIAVLGDLIADHWLHARPSRLSREAPVIVLRHEREELACGGAANVARNLRALGAEVAVFGAVGRDATGRELTAALGAERIEVGSIASIPGWTTPTKTRVLAAEPRRNPQQILRIDREPSGPIPDDVRRAAAAAVRARISDFDALLVSDYEYGLVGREAAVLAREFTDRGLVAVLDPRRGLGDFTGALSALTPNVGELATFVRCSVDDLTSARGVRAAAQELRARVDSRWLLVTRGNLGMALFGAGIPAEGLWIPASGEGEVTDVCGAGDTAAAVFTLALAARLDPAEAMRFANAASGVVVMESGAATCSPTQLAAALVTAPSPAVACVEGT
ncbi:MAG: PfkB family carbohydrate kinase [Planctomycetota bacterium]|nr:PfkB family carbohydrate kinase [Planctomycetota bacterium]